jgi:hypothetical protein
VVDAGLTNCILPAAGDCSTSFIFFFKTWETFTKYKKLKKQKHNNFYKSLIAYLRGTWFLLKYYQYISNVFCLLMNNGETVGKKFAANSTIIAANGKPMPVRTDSFAAAKQR